MTTANSSARDSGTGPGPGPSPQPIPVPGQTRHTWDGDEYSSDSSSDMEEMDPNQFDLMLSRSVQSAGPVLEPEAFEHSMLRNTRVRSHSYSDRRRVSAQGPVLPRAGAAADQAGVVTAPAAPGEETPLLGVAREEEEEGGEEEEEEEELVDEIRKGASPYLGGVSVGRFWMLFGQIMVGYFISCFDSTIMASSHPVITSYFGSSNSASWLSTAFLLTSTSFQPLLGGLSDAVGRKAPYVATTAVFLLATLWCALAGSMTSFIVARAVCGLGAGGMMTLGSIIVSDVVPIEIRGTYQSYINITYGVGSMLGAALGGAMADYLGWRWEFGVQVPILLACLVVASIVLPDNLGLYGRKRQTFLEAMRTFDLKGSFLMSTSVTFLILGLNLGGNVMPWSHPFVIASLVIFAVFFPLFLFVETRAIKPIMPIHLVLKSPHMNLIISNHLTAFLANAILFNVPLFFQGVLLTSATTSGFRLVTASAVSSATGTATGFLITWTRRLKWPLTLGASLITAGTLCLALMRRGWPTAAYLLCLVPGAAGQGFQFPGTFMAVLAVSSQHEQAVVTSTLLLWRSLGQVLGVACSSLVLQNALWHYLERYVDGPRKEAVVRRARRSVEAIRGLPPEYLGQVVRSYEAALRMTFLCCAALALVSLLLLVPVRLPRLGKK